jgi:tRNA (guanine-N1)-methyltransferase
VIRVDWDLTGELALRCHHAVSRDVRGADGIGNHPACAGAGLWQIECWNPRQWTQDVHRTVDDRPYGGGPGMVMMASPLEQAINAAKAAAKSRCRRNGESDLPFAAGQRGSTSGGWRNWRQATGAILLCGRYEGIDERLIERCVDEELSLGDFVLSGGELAAMALMDACIRQLPGALNDEASAVEDSFAAACWTVRTTRGRRCMKDVRCRMCCCPATMKQSGAGA